MDGEWKEAWNTYTRNLILSGIHLTTQPDSLVWEYNKKDGIISADKVYDCIVKSLSSSRQPGAQNIVVRYSSVQNWMLFVVGIKE